MVAIGGTVGFGVAWLFLRPQEKRWEEVVASSDTDTGSISLASTALVVNEERFAYFRRVGCAFGGAAGITTAFNAPIGGILYMFEELAVSSLPPDLARFMSTVFGALAARALLQLTQMDVHRLVIYDSSTAFAQGAQGHWDWYDVPLMALLAAVLGGVGALFSKVLLATWKFRRKTNARLQRYQPWAKIAESVLYCLLVTVVWALVPAFFECQELPVSANGAGSGGHRLLGESSSLDYVRHTCPEGQYNEVATYLLSGAEGAVKHLYKPGTQVQRSGPLAVTFIFYFALACGMPGLAVPMGTFVPSMLSGALVGRLFGENTNLLHETLNMGEPYLAPAGVYAVVGSASVLAGLTHMTVGIVALLAEAVGDFGLILPLMLAVLVAQAVSKWVSHFGYDEHLIMMKGIPFLDPEVPREMQSEDLVAGDMCEVPPDEALLLPKTSVKSIKRALKQRQVKYFPIISEGSICVGLTTRGRLRAVLEAVSQNAARQEARKCRRPSIESNGSTVSRRSEASSSVASSDIDSSTRTPSETASIDIDDHLRMAMRRSSQGHLLDVQAEARMKGFIKVMFSEQNKPAEDREDGHEVEELVPIDRIMDWAPHALREDMPVSRFYNVFNKTDAHVAIVVSKRGRFRGILTRASLINLQIKLHNEGHRPREQPAPRGSESEASPANSQAAAGAKPDAGVEGTSRQERSGNDPVIQAVAGNLRPEEMQAELAGAWKSVADGERVQDELREQLRRSDKRIRDLELQLFGTPVTRTPSKSFLTFEEPAEIREEPTSAV